MATPIRRIAPALTIGGQAFQVLSWELDESLDEPSTLRCDLSLGDEALPRPGALVDQATHFTLTRDDDQVRRFHGLVVSAEVLPDEQDVPFLRVEVAPSLWELGQRADCRIFQEKSAVDIVKAVLEGAGIAADKQEWKLGEDHPVRTYTVQYRETDLDFVRRLLFEEGIHFAIHGTEEADKLVFGDAPDGLGDVEGETTLEFHPEFGHELAADVVRHVEHVTAVRSDKTYTRDYDPERPRLDVSGGAEGSDPGEHGLEVYDWPARSHEPAIAARRAKVLLESMQAERALVRAETGSLALWPGLRFSIANHPYEPLDQEYLVVRARIAGATGELLPGRRPREPFYRNEVWGVPTATTRYQPPRRAREQRIPGLQTAMTTGASGSEIHTDAAGQVKARFHWDRAGITDDTSSRWMRTSQLATGGSMLLPRVGWEVTVAHLEGDVDEPLVMARMTNAQTPPPYALPGGAAKSALQTATSPGGGSSNEMRMSDSAGSEEMFMNASKDMTTEVKNNSTESIGNDHKKKVGSNQTRNVTDSQTSSVGANQTLDVGGNQTIKVETFMVDDVGSHSLTIGGGRDLKVGGDHKRDVTGASKLEVGGSQIDLVVGSVTDQTLASMSHEVGAALVELAVGDRVLTVGGAYNETAGAAKIIAVKGGRGVSTTGAMNVKVGGAVVHIANADRSETSGAGYTEIAAGAQIVKAKNVVFEAKSMLSVVMGASTITLMPAVAAIAGLKLKIDGEVTDTAALIVDN